MRYYDGRFLNDQFFCLFVHNTMQRHHNNSQGNFFFNSDKFIGKNPPTIEDLKNQLKNGDASYVQMLRYFSRNIKGSDNFWRARQDDLEAWVAHHVSRGRGPPTFFMTFSCAENWWPDLRRLIAQLERHAGNDLQATKIEMNDFRAMSKSVKRYPLYVNEFFMKRFRSFMDTVVKQALGIEHYWGRVEFAPGRGQIHLHLLAIAKDRAYLDEFYRASSMKEKAAVVEKYATERLDMTADVSIMDDASHRLDPHVSPLAKKFCECRNEDEDVRLLAQECMCHECNAYCMEDNGKNRPRSCRMGFGAETEFGKGDTPGMPITTEPTIVKDKKGISHFRMMRTKSTRVVQHSRTLLRSWRANCDIKLLLYYSDPNLPDIGEIEEVCRYVVAYTAKKHSTARSEKEAIQNLIMR